MSLDISSKVNSNDLELYHLIDEVASSLNISYFLIGAHVRDMIMKLAFNVESIRSTEDVDYAIEVDSWNKFQELRDEFLLKGFQLTNKNHSFISPNGIKIDIVPFGNVENDHEQVQWPPNGDMTMSVSGFRSAHDRKVMVIVSKDPEFLVPVVTMEDMVIFKLISWSERDSDIRSKDAQDILFIVEHYEKIPEVESVLYDDDLLADHYHWDMELVGSHLCGKNSKSMATESSLKLILEVYRDETQYGRFKSDAGVNYRGGRDRCTELLKAFFSGFDV